MYSIEKRLNKNIYMKDKTILLKYVIWGEVRHFQNGREGCYKMAEVFVKLKLRIRANIDLHAFYDPLKNACEADSGCKRR